MGAAFDAALSAAVGGADPAEKVARFAVENDILIDQIVRAEFLKQFEQMNTFPLGNPGDATITLEIKAYGLYCFEHKERFFGPSLRHWVPVLIVQAEMVDASGRVLWRKTASPYMNAVITDPSAWRLSYPVYSELSLSEISSNPDELRRLWQGAAPIAGCPLRSASV